MGIAQKQTSKLHSTNNIGMTQIQELYKGDLALHNLIEKTVTQKVATQIHHY